MRNKRIAENRVISLIVFCLAITFLVLWLYILSGIEKDLEKKVVSSSNAIVVEVNSTLTEYLNILLSGKAFYMSSDSVSRSDFKHFIESQNILDRYRAIRAIEFIERVSGEDKDVYVQRVRSEGYPDFNIKPDVIREEYLVVTYLEPFEGNEEAFGYDLSSNPERKKALELARDIDDFVITEPITLVQDDEAAFLAVVPVYDDFNTLKFQERRDNLEGYFLAVFDLSELFVNSLGNNVFSNDVDFYITDGEDLVFESRPGVSNVENEGLFFKTNISVGSRVWEFASYPSDSLIDNHNRQEITAISILIVGLLLGLSLLVILFLLIKSKQRAEDMAEKITGDLRVEKEKVTKDLKDVQIKSKDIEKALNEANESRQELERLNELMVGREQKMIELKKEISRLKGE